MCVIVLLMLWGYKFVGGRRPEAGYHYINFSLKTEKVKVKIHYFSKK